MRTFGLGPSVAWRRISDEVVVLKLDSGEYFSLPQAAADVWEWLVQGADEGAARERLQAVYDASSKAAEKDLKAFVAEVLTEKLLVTSKEKAKGAAAFKSPARKRAYSRLALRKHSTLDPKFYALATY